MKALIPDDFTPFSEFWGVGSWSITPCGCFLWKDVQGYHAHFDVGGSTCAANPGSPYESYLLCTEQPPGIEVNSIVSIRWQKLLMLFGIVLNPRMYK